MTVKLEEYGLTVVNKNGVVIGAIWIKSDGKINFSSRRQIRNKKTIDMTPLPPTTVEELRMAMEYMEKDHADGAT